MRRKIAKKRVLLVSVLYGTALAVGAPVARAEIGSDKSAAIVIFPKLVVDTSNGLDTLIRLSNTSDRPITMQCFYINATPKCSLPAQSCFPDPSGCYDASGLCKPLWQETDFFVRLTAFQPTSWLVSEGTFSCSQVGQGVCSNNIAQSCTRSQQCGGARCILPPCLPIDSDQPVNGQSNEGRVPPSAEDPFIGELKCIALDESLVPVARNDIKGEALIGFHDSGTGFIDVAGYNAIGIPAVPGQGNRDKVLRIGGAGNPFEPDDPCHEEGNCPEYEGCPNLLILDHVFDGAVDPVIPNLCRGNVCSVSLNACTADSDCMNVCDGGNCRVTATLCNDDEDCDPLVGKVRIATDLTLIPCTQDLENQDPDLSAVTAQFLVFNEFEQRFSTSREVNCFQEKRLSDLDRLAAGQQNDRSIFSAGVGGTLTGQTRIRGVVPTARPGSGESPTGFTLLGVAEEFRCRGPEFPLCSFIRQNGLVSSAAVNVHFQGRRPLSDFLYLP